MSRLVSKLLHQDVLSICVLEESVICAVGGSIYCYSDSILQFTKFIFPGQKIHLLRASYGRNLIIVAGKSVGVCCIKDVKGEIDVTTRNSSDWILDADQTNADELTIVTAHNEAQLWKIAHLEFDRVSSSSERCILYSAKIHKADGKLLIFAGTVFSEVIVWQAEFELASQTPQPVLFRLKGHKGVIFSISIGHSPSHPVVICTTSDDRSVRLMTGRSLDQGAELENHPPWFGHKARVWKSLFFSDRILTIGEDSLLCCWTWEGRLLSQTHVHHGGGIRSLTCTGSSLGFLTGGGDGGIFELPRNSILTKPNSSRVDEFPSHIIPRKVCYLSGGGIAILTDIDLFYRKKTCGPFLKSRVGGLENCTDMDTSNCGKFVGITTVSGWVFIFDTSLQSWLSFNVSNGKRCESLHWRGDFLLIQCEDGVANLFSSSNLCTSSFSLIAIFLLPKYRQRGFTCFLRLPKSFSPNETLVGDRLGNLHVYNDTIETPCQTLEHLHSALGLSDIFYQEEPKRVLTVGAGGWVRVLGLLEGHVEFCLLRSIRAPMESAVRILDSPRGRMVAGFHGSDLKLWDYNTRMAIATFKCGGGHRSFDLSISYDQVDFIFIKDKKVYQVPFPLKSSVVLRNCYHSQIINCLAALKLCDSPVVVSGSDDTTIRIVQLGITDIKPLYVLEQHISSVRAICVTSFRNSTNLIVAAGGREQISISEFDLVHCECRELVSHLPSGSQAQGRYMCLETWKLADRVLILVGCSDGSLRIFKYCDTLLQIGIFQHTHCILQVTILGNYAVTLGTDGKAVFWDLTSFRRDGPTRAAATPVVEFTIHQSGINSVLVKQRSHNEFLLVTGGDDNLLSVIVVRLVDGEKHRWEMVSRWTTANAHACQITGLVGVEDWLVSTAVDQRVVLHRIIDDVGAVRLEHMDEILVSVPDPHGLSIVKVKTDLLTVCVFGKGIEVVEIRL